MRNLRHDRVAGLGNSEGSQRALNLLYTIRTIQQRNGKDFGAAFLSGTTISNSLKYIANCQSYTLFICRNFLVTLHHETTLQHTP